MYNVYECSSSAIFFVDEMIVDNVNEDGERESASSDSDCDMD